MIQKIPPEARHIGDGTSIAVLLGSLTDYLPAVAALLTIVWTGIRIWETETVQRVFNKTPDK